jgi:hypothetical protein
MKIKIFEEIFSGFFSSLTEDALVFGAAATMPKPQLILNTTTGALSFDPDGIGEKAQQIVSDEGLAVLDQRLWDKPCD